MLEITRDQLWKAILEDLFDDFLRWFYEPYLESIDFERPFEFLDQELLKIYPESAETGRFVDKLVKVWLKNGNDSWFLLHVEAQSYPDPSFAERMYIYQYRIRDRHRRDITALAILADDSPTYRPETYRYEFMGTTLLYQFRVCKIRELQIDTLEQSKNPFALALAVAWYGLKQNNRNDRERLNFKIQLVKKLMERQVKRDGIKRLLEFIKFYTKFDRVELYRDFEEIIHPNRTKMGILELVREASEKYWKNVGKAEGKAEGTRLVIEKLLQKGFTDEQVSELLEIPLEFVQQIRAGHPEDPAGKVW